MRLVDALLMLLVDVLWGFNFIAAKVGMAHFPPVFFTALRFGLLFILLSPFLRRIRRGERRTVFGIAFTLGVLHFPLMFTGLALASDVSSIAIVTQLQVPFAVIFAALWLKEAAGLRRWLGIAIAFGGVVVIGFDPIVFQHLEALFLVILASAVFAVNTVMARTIRTVNAFNLQAWIAACAAPSLLVISLIFERGQWQSLETAGWQPWSGVIFSCVGASVIGHGIVYSMLRRYPVSVTTPWVLLVPIFAVLFGILFWGDRPSARLYAGGLLTIGGVGIITLRRPERVAAVMESE